MAIRGSRLAQASPDDSMIQATLAPLEQLRRMNSLFDEADGSFPGWMNDEG